MFKVNDLIVYKRDVCKIKEVKEKMFNNLDYLILEPITDNSLIIQIPVNNNKIRKLMTKNEAENLIKRIPKIDILDKEDRLLETEYKNLLQDEKIDSLITIIKTTYLRNELKRNNNKKISEKDENYFNLSENYLNIELSIALNIPKEKVKDYIKFKIENS